MKPKFVIVYQAGIANLFRVESFSAALPGTEKRVAQDAFRVIESMAHGAILAGAAIRVASCNVAGDVAPHTWTRGLADCPFRDNASPPRYRNGDGMADAVQSLAVAELLHWRKFFRDNGMTDRDYHDANGDGWISRLDRVLKANGALPA